MGARERKRAERRKRKRRATDAKATVRDAPADGGPAGARLARSEARDRQAREALEPLREGQRPTAVTIGAIVSAAIALIFWGSFVAALMGLEVRGEEPSPIPLAVFAVVVTMMAVGMYRARYWAVLGFQAMLVLLMLSATLGLTQGGTLLQFAATLCLLGMSATLFYFMVKALARIQMPRRASRD